MNVGYVFFGLLIILGIVFAPMAVYTTLLCVRKKYHHELWLSLGSPMPGLANRYKDQTRILRFLRLRQYASLKSAGAAANSRSGRNRGSNIWSAHGDWLSGSGGEPPSIVGRNGEPVLQQRRRHHRGRSTRTTGGGGAVVGGVRGSQFGAPRGGGRVSAAAARAHELLCTYIE